MTSLLGRIFNGHPVEAVAPMRGDIAYAKAMEKSDDLLHKVSNGHRPHPVLSVIAEIWAQRSNTPFQVTVVETVQEMAAPIKQSPHDWPPK